jgi:uncharacterized protein
MVAAQKLDLLKAVIARKGPMIISYSGGVDSSLLAAVAKEVLGDQTACVLLDSPVVPRTAIEQADRIARDLGLRLEIVQVPVMEDREFRKNPPDRCYFCKKISAQLLREKANEFRITCIADGTNISDLGENRPGLTAGSEEGIVHPFIEAGITKEDIRYIAHEYGYDFWNKPSAACLSSRVPYGEEITPEKLRMIEEAENFLSEKGFTQFRVRMSGRMARIEVLPDEFPGLIGIRKEVTKRLKEIGFSYVALDLEGYRSGSMDEVL